MLDFLEQRPEAGTPVLHWFSGSPSELQRAVSLGCWFSVGPAMLSNEKGRALAARMPRDRMLTESDGPFAQIDGKSLMPWHVENALSTLSDVWSVPPEEVRETIEANLKTLLDTHPA